MSAPAPAACPCDKWEPTCDGTGVVFCLAGCGREKPCPGCAECPTDDFPALTLCEDYDEGDWCPEADSEL